MQEQHGITLLHLSLRLRQGSQLILLVRKYAAGGALSNSPSCACSAISERHRQHTSRQRAKVFVVRIDAYFVCITERDRCRIVDDWIRNDKKSAIAFRCLNYKGTLVPIMHVVNVMVGGYLEIRMEKERLRSGKPAARARFHGR